MKGFLSFRVTRVLVLLLISAAATGVAQAKLDPLIEGGRLCTQQFPIQEQKNNIPTHLLAAISTTESGRWHDGLGMAVPWPWTINVDGKGYYFNTKAEAIAQTQHFLSTGHQSIDVGCMQVNLKHHAHAFGDLNQAFDPKQNVAYAAKFLHDNYADLGDWIKATAAYHSRNEPRGRQYLAQIERSWNRIVTKVASARASVGSSAAGSVTQVAEDAPSEKTQKVVTVKRDTMRVASRPIAATHGVNSVQVSDASPEVAKPKPVLVIQAAPTPAPAPTPAAKPEVAAAAPVVGDSVRRVALDNPAATPNDGAARTKFVFAN